MVFRLNYQVKQPNNDTVINKSRCTKATRTL